MGGNLHTRDLGSAERNNRCARHCARWQRWHTVPDCCIATGLDGYRPGCVYLHVQYHLARSDKLFDYNLYN
jgi:hypothetical protein